MIRLCSRFDSVLFTPKMPAIPSYGNYSRSPKVEIGDGAAGDLTIVRPAGRAAHRAAEAKMRRAGFFGYHPPRDKEHHRASAKCRRESTPQTPITVLLQARRRRS
jgi:hypothetical protein